MPLVIDASVTMTWCFADESTAFGEELIWRVRRERAFVPSIWPIEVTNSIVAGERRGRLTVAETAKFLDLLREMPIIFDEETSARAWTVILPLARQFSLSAYDASYVDLASRRGLPLATVDRRMRQAAVQAGIDLIEPEE